MAGPGGSAAGDTVRGAGIGKSRASSSSSRLRSLSAWSRERRARSLTQICTRQEAMLPASGTQPECEEAAAKRQPPEVTKTEVRGLVR